MRFHYDLEKGHLRPDLTPIIDVVFLLLIFFMLGSNFVYSTQIKVKLPEATSATIVDRSAVTITVDKESNLYLDDKSISFQDLDKILAAIDAEPLSILADKEAPLGTVITVWDAARRHHLEEIAIRTRN